MVVHFCLYDTRYTRKSKCLYSIRVELSRTLLNIDKSMIFTIIITQFYFYRVTPFNTAPLYLVLKCLIFCAHAINYCIFKRHQWLKQKLTMKTCSFLDLELPWCIWKTKPLIPRPGYFPFSVADFFLRFWICTYWQVQT